MYARPWAAELPPWRAGAARALPYAAAHGIGVLAYEPLAHGLLGGAIAETTTFDADDWRSHSRACGQLGHQRLARGRGPCEQDAQGQVGQRKLEQQEQCAAGGDHQGRLQREHQGRNGQQAGDAA
jgi:aryl-alcohol dehydrogenase-like predicted oxidoreductase